MVKALALRIAAVVVGVLTLGEVRDNLGGILQVAVVAISVYFGLDVLRLLFQIFVDVAERPLHLLHQVDAVLDDAGRHAALQQREAGADALDEGFCRIAEQIFVGHEHVAELHVAGGGAAHRDEVVVEAKADAVPGRMDDRHDTLRLVLALHFDIENRAEIAVLDVEAADHSARAIGDGELLVVADQITPAPFRLEAGEAPARLDERREKVVIDLVRSEPVDRERDGDAALRRADQGIAHALPARIVPIHVVEGAETRLRAVDQGDQSIQPVLAGGVEGKRLPLRFDGERLGILPCRRPFAGSLTIAVREGGWLRHLPPSRRSDRLGAIP